MAEPGDGAEGLAAPVTPQNTVAEIREYAGRVGIDLAGARTKAQMLAAIAEGRSG